MSSAALIIVAFVLYFAAAVCFGATLFLSAPKAPSASAPPSSVRVGRLGYPFLLLGVLVNFAAIGVWCVTTRHSPFASAFGTLSVAAWVMGVAVAVLELRTRLPAVSAVALSVACLVLFLGFLRSGGPIAADPQLKSQVVSLHVLAILVSFALFLQAFGCACLYLLQNRLLRGHHVRPLFRRIPPLATLDTIAYQSVAFALPLLTIGLALGIARVFGGGLSQPTSAWFLDPHAIASFAAWFLYVFYICARHFAGWGGARLQSILVVGLLVTLTLYFMPSQTHRFS